MTTSRPVKSNPSARGVAVSPNGTVVALSAGAPTVVDLGTGQTIELAGTRSNRSAIGAVVGG